jgi:ABC-type sulfate transport system permease subunit
LTLSAAWAQFLVQAITLSLAANIVLGLIIGWLVTRRRRP